MAATGLCGNGDYRALCRQRNRCTKAGGIEVQKQIQLQKVEVARALGVGSSSGQWSLDAWQGSDLPDESEVQGLFLPF